MRTQHQNNISLIHTIKNRTYEGEWFEGSWVGGVYVWVSVETMILDHKNKNTIEIENRNK
jgi:hypothetical protein